MKLTGKVDVTNAYAKIPHRKQTRAFYINVGSMPAIRATAHIEQIKKNMQSEGLDSIHYENFFFAVSGDEPNRVEVFP